MDTGHVARSRRAKSGEPETTSSEKSGARVTNVWPPETEQGRRMQDALVLHLKTKSLWKTWPARCLDKSNRPKKRPSRQPARVPPVSGYISCCFQHDPHGGIWFVSSFLTEQQSFGSSMVFSHRFWRRFQGRFWSKQLARYGASMPRGHGRRLQSRFPRSCLLWCCNACRYVGTCARL